MCSVQFFFRSITLSSLVRSAWQLCLLQRYEVQCDEVMLLSLSCLPLIIEMFDISQNPFYLYSVHRTSVSGERSKANGPLVFC